MYYKEKFLTYSAVQKLTDEMIKRSLYSLGNYDRIALAMQKAQRGEAITIGFIGGSVTQGALASSLEKCYAGIVADWWKNKFPMSEINYINAGIGSTTSVLGVHRVERHLLNANPDFILQEFAINDGSIQMYKDSYEALTRRFLSCPSKPGLMLLFLTNKNANGIHGNQERYHRTVGEYYNLPMVSCSEGFWKEVEEGKITWEELGSIDDVHPTDGGHAVVALLVINLLEEIYSKIESNSFNDKIELPKPMNVGANDYMQAKSLSNKDIEPLDYGGWQKAENVFVLSPAGWKIENSENTPIVFKIKAKHIDLFSKRIIDGTGANILVDANGQKTEIKTDFEGGWGEFCWEDPVFDSESEEEVTLKISIKADGKKNRAMLGYILVR